MQTVGTEQNYLFALTLAWHTLLQIGDLDCSHAVGT